jgi:hypothetical protein
MGQATCCQQHHKLTLASQNGYGLSWYSHVQSRKLRGVGRNLYSTFDAFRLCYNTRSEIFKGGARLRRPQLAV